MGRKTFESILKRLGKPLPNRKNVVVTRDAQYVASAEVCLHHTVEEALAHHQNEEIMVAGGGEIFKQTIARADRLYITEVHREVDGDVYFPAIDPEVWKETEREDYEGYSFVRYVP